MKEKQIIPTIKNFATISKKDLRGTVQEHIKDIDPMKAIAEARRLKELATEIEKAVKPSLSKLIGEGERVEVSGGTLYYGAGKGYVYRSSASFGHCAAWVEATEKLKALEAGMKAAAENGHLVSLDPETGEELPKAIPVNQPPPLKYDF